MGHSEVDKARLLPSGDIEINLVLPNSAKGAQLLISAVVTQEAAGGHPTRAVAHTSFLFTPEHDGQPAVFTVQLAEGSRPFDPHVGIEARATSTYTCWSTLDGAGPAAASGSWTLSDWG
jgi:hypothetical protein